MNTLITKSALASAIALSIVACSPSGSGGLAGIGGSGYVSSGSVSGFGSVFVNGVEFETDSATFDIDGVSGTQDDLAIGMVVRVNGTINDDGISGTATNISYDEELKGPVTGLTAPDADGITRSFMVLGIKVILDSSGTTFDIDSDLPVSTVFDFDNIENDNNVEINGFFDSNGDINATRVELKDITFDSSSIVEIKGTISGLSGTDFMLASLAVDASAATLDDLPNGLENGLFVEVNGTLDATRTILMASKVEAEDNTIDDIDEFELEGIITDYVDDSNFKINGTTVDASSATREPASIILENDLHIEAEGTIINGVLIAKEVELEGGDIKVRAKVTSIDTAAGSFEVSPVSGQSITVTITTGTQLEDDVNDVERFTLNNLVVTDFVEVRGFDDGSGGITAVEVDVKEQGDVVLQGYATSATGTAASGGTITILDVTFNFDGLTDFEDENDFDITDPQVINDLIIDINDISTAPRLIKIEDNEPGTDGNPVGTADEIDIESP